MTAGITPGATIPGITVLTGPGGITVIMESTASAALRWVEAPALRTVQAVMALPAGLLTAAAVTVRVVRALLPEDIIVVADPQAVAPIPVLLLLREAVAAVIVPAAPALRRVADTIVAAAHRVRRHLRPRVVEAVRVLRHLHLPRTHAEAPVTLRRRAAAAAAPSEAAGAEAAEAEVAAVTGEKLFVFYQLLSLWFILVLFTPFFSHVGPTTLLHQAAKIPQNILINLSVNKTKQFL